MNPNILSLTTEPQLRLFWVTQRNDLCVVSQKIITDSLISARSLCDPCIFHTLLRNTPPPSPPNHSFRPSQGKYEEWRIFVTVGTNIIPKDKNIFTVC